MAISVKLNNVRLSYEHIFKASAFDENQTAKFSAELIIPKDHPDLANLRRALMDAGKERFPSAFTSTNWPTGYTCALKDCDKATDSNGVLLAEKNEAYKGCFIIKADSTRRPIVVHRDRRPVTEEDGVIYSGCYVNVSIGISGYEFGKVKKGVKCYLNGVQFVSDGERFGRNAVDDFEDLDGGAGDDLPDWM